MALPQFNFLFHICLPWLYSIRNNKLWLDAVVAVIRSNSFAFFNILVWFSWSNYFFFIEIFWYFLYQCSKNNYLLDSARSGFQPYDVLMWASDVTEQTLKFLERTENQMKFEETIFFISWFEILNFRNGIDKIDHDKSNNTKRKLEICFCLKILFKSACVPLVH